MEIWKFPLQPIRRQAVVMPHSGHILCVQVQRGDPCMWAMVDPKNDGRERIIDGFMTGEDMPSYAGLYIGTVMLLQGTFVMHYFDSMLNPEPRR